MEYLIKQYVFSVALLSASLTPSFAQVSSENYVQTSTRLSDTQMQTVTQYYDGFGRPTEQVDQGVTPYGDNLVYLQEYDVLGRDWRTWLPVKSSTAFLSTGDVGSLASGNYRDSHAFKSQVYDGSPLNVTKTTDEDGHVSYEFKNLSDQVVLRRSMLGGNESADTYYVYDYRGNLSLVLPPNYQEEASLDKYVYQYKYDGRGNCVWKKLPGCEPVYMKYTRNNRLVYNANNGSLSPKTALFNDNMVSDLNKGICSITYDHNNLPREICDNVINDGGETIVFYPSIIISKTTLATTVLS